MGLAERMCCGKCRRTDRKWPEFFSYNAGPVRHGMEKQSSCGLCHYPNMPFCDPALPVAPNSAVGEILVGKGASLLKRLGCICPIVYPNRPNGDLKTCCKVFKALSLILTSLRHLWKRERSGKYIECGGPPTSYSNDTAAM